jgi:hypothetical protein
LGDKIKKNEIGETCGTNGGQEGFVQVCGGFDLSEGNNLENLGVDGRIILKWIFSKWIRGMEGTAVSQDKGRWQAFVNAVMNIFYLCLTVHHQCR